MKTGFCVWRNYLRATLVIAFAFYGEAKAEYYSFDVPSGVDIVSQEVRWPVWAESTYNAVWTNDIVSGGKSSVYFYGGVPEANAENPIDHPASIIWSFWPVSHPVNPGETVKVCWGNPQMYAPLAVGEGASGKASGVWPQLKTKQWYQFVMRVWQPIENPLGHAFAAQWLHDPADGHWYHVATMEIPFKATGTSGMSGFIEDFSHGNRNPRRTEFRNDYYHLPGGNWKPAKNLTPSVRQHGEKGTVDLIEGGTASFFETCSGEDYKGNLDYDAHIEKRTVTMNEPDSPGFPMPTIETVSAIRSGKQFLVFWNIAPTALPQFAWKIDGLDSDGQSVASAQSRDPDARQAFISAGNISKVRLTITDIFDQSVTSQIVVPKMATVSAGNKFSNVKTGLDFACFEAPASGSKNWNQLPNFSELKPVLSGTTNGIDMTVRRRRTKYAIDYSGFIQIPTTGIYAFRLSSYDGSRLLIDNMPVIDNDGIHSYTDKSSYAGLSAGLHPIEIQYFRDTDRGEHCEFADRVNLDWQGPSFAMQPVPLTAYVRRKQPDQPVATLVAPTGSMIPSAPVKLDVHVASGGGAINRVAYYVDDILWASRDAQPIGMQVVLPKGSFDLHARLFTKSGQAYDTLPVHIQTNQVPTVPWNIVQIGTPPPRRPLGAAITGTDSVYLVGDGNGIAWQQLNGNVTITAHVADRPHSNVGTQDDGTTPEGDWSGGILFRSDLTAHDTFLGDQFVAAYARADASTHLQCQKDHNGGGPVAGPDLGHFDWIKLQRTGDTFTASFSTDGKTWEEKGTRTVELPAKLYGGVFIYSTAGYNQHINAWRFDHVTIK
jgi:hypothetical protein